MHSNIFREIGLNDISVEQRDIAEIIGMEGYKRLVTVCGGSEIYIPKADTLVKQVRDREIHAAYDGTNAKELAKRYNLTVRRVRQIVHEGDV